MRKPRVLLGCEKVSSLAHATAKEGKFPCRLRPRTVKPYWDETLALPACRWRDRNGSLKPEEAAVMGR
jgi:hypothetical protein